jgi:hypothetical protein
MKYREGMAATTAPRQCAYPGCDQATAAPGSDRGARPKYCDDPEHNPLSAHRERRRDAGASGQRSAETGGQPVTLGITRAAELIGTLEKLTAQHADTLTRAITELRAAGDIESAEAEVYAARTSADQRIAAAHARLAEEIQRRRDAEAQRDTARAARGQADDATARAVSRIQNLERELAELRSRADAEVREARDDAARQVAGAEARARQASQDTATARQGEVAAITRADQAQATAAAETARIRADHQHALDQLTTATSARIQAVEETRDALRTRAERAETDLDTARGEIRRLAGKPSQATGTAAGPAPAEPAPAQPRTANRPETAPPRAAGTGA